MTAKNFDFTHTKNAIEELDTALLSLEKAIKNKTIQTEKQTEKIAKLRLSTKEVIDGIDVILKKLDKAVD